MNTPRAIHLAQDLRTFFEGQVRESARKQGLELSPFVHAYLGRLLERFSDTQNYLNKSASGEGRQEFPVLALMYLEGLSTRDPQLQQTQLQHLGDVALFTSGFFGERILRSAVDMDYYVAIGHSAYERAGQLRESLSAERFLNVFFEMAQSFPALVEVLSEVADQSKLVDNEELLKLYQKWLGNRSERLRRMLAEKGVIASKGGGRN